MKSEIKAVYRAREDGDYDFMAAFANCEVFDGDPAETYAESLRAQGEEAVVKDFADLMALVDVLDGASVFESPRDDNPAASFTS